MASHLTTDSVPCGRARTCLVERDGRRAYAGPCLKAAYSVPEFRRRMHGIPAALTAQCSRHVHDQITLANRRENTCVSSMDATSR